MFSANPLPVPIENLVQKRTEVAALKLIDIAFSETKSIHCEVTEWTLTKCFQPRCTSTDTAVTRKQFACNLIGEFFLSR